MGSLAAGMDPGGRDNRPPHHEFALELERARREAGLKPKELASKLFVDPRTVRRYLNGERLPTIETTDAWERACNIEAGRLSRMHPATARGGRNSDAEGGSASAAERASTGGAAAAGAGPRERRQWVLPTLVGLAVFVALGVVLLMRRVDEPPRRSGLDRPTAVAYHRFTASYVGDVWIRITPAREHAGESHRVTLRWGPNMQEVDLKSLDRSRALFTGKNRRDRVTITVNVKPAAMIAFGERNVPPGALDIKEGWTKAE